MFDKIFDFLDKLSLGMLFVLAILVIFVLIKVVSFVASIFPLIVLLAALGIATYIIAKGHDRSK